MKALIETRGSIMLMDLSTNTTVAYDRPSVVEHGNFLQNQVALQNVTILVPELPEEATDEEWAEWLKASDGDVKLAAAAYAAKFEPAPEDVPDPKMPKAD